MGALVMSGRVDGAESETGKPIPSPAVAAFPLDEELVLCEEPTGQVFVLNPTGARIWALLDGTRSTREVAADLAASYGIDYGTALRDVDELVAELVDAGLLRS